MPDADLKVTFGSNAQKLSFVQGEDRTVPLVVQDKMTGEPVDLTACNLQVCLPRIGGGTVRRVSGTETTTAVQASSPLKLVSHGLATGDVVAVSVVPGGTLPTGLTAGSYVVRVVDNDTFALQQSGVDAIVTAAGVGTLVLTNSADLVIDAATLGHAVLTLSAAVTAAVRDGMAQDMQVNIVAASGKRRIAVLKDVLDVWAQPEP
jgi:hypothetical protein